MIFAIRADAGIVQGTGHVMRCLSLAEKLLQKGHRVGLFTNTSEISWLESAIESSGVEVFRVPSDEISSQQFDELTPDWVIVDSYQISAEKISDLNEQIRVMAIIDGDFREIRATAYLDTNLFAEKLDWPKAVKAKMLAGSTFALVRDAVLEHKRSHPEQVMNTPAKLLVFLGGSDPYGHSPLLAEALSKVVTPFEARFIAPPASHAEVLAKLGVNSKRVELLAPTPRLATFYAKVDAVVSAAGTSAWDVCSLGIPALFLSVVDNQEFSLKQIDSAGLALTNNLDVVGDEKAGQIAGQITRLLTEQNLRSALSTTSLKYFDGLGRDRVEEFLTRI